MEWVEQNKAVNVSDTGEFVAVFQWKGEHDFEMAPGTVAPKYSVSCGCIATIDFDFENRRVTIKGKVDKYMPLPGQPEVQIMRKKVTILKPNPHGPGMINQHQLWMALKQVAAGIRKPTNS